MEKWITILEEANDDINKKFKNLNINFKKLISCIIKLDSNIIKSWNQFKKIEVNDDFEFLNI